MSKIANNPFEFEDGDLRILVTYKGQRLVGSVSAAVMVRASPVWKKFIFPPFAQLDPEDEDDGIIGSALYDGSLSGPTKRLRAASKDVRGDDGRREEITSEDTIRNTQNSMQNPGQTLETDADSGNHNQDEDDGRNKYEWADPRFNMPFTCLHHRDAIWTPQGVFPRQDLQTESSEILSQTKSTGATVGKATSSAEKIEGLGVPRANKRKIMGVPRARELDFTEDNRDALLILLYIVHHQIEELSDEKMSLDALLPLAVLCDMYDCVKLVKPWLSHWCNFEDLENDPEAALETVLFIMWVFKKRIPVSLRVKAAKTIAITISGDYGFQTGDRVRPINLDHFPSKELDHVLAVREETLRDMQRIACQHLKLAVTTQCKWGRVACPELMYGSIAMKLNHFGFGPIRKSPGDVGRVKGSVQVIALALSRLPRTRTRAVGHDALGRSTHGHERCPQKNGRSTMQEEINRAFEFVATRCRTGDT